MGKQPTSWRVAMNCEGLLLASVVAISLFLLFVNVEAEAAESGEADVSVKPNIVVILADDLGWRDVGYHGSEIKTPNIDRIAGEGVELDRFYVQPTCSPTRTALMTGKSPLRLGITTAIGKNETSGIPLDQTLLPEQLGQLGYQSLMVGKWHLGHYNTDLFPQARGFEHFYGHVTGGIGYWDHNHGGGHDWQRNGETLREEGYSTTLMTEEAVRLLAGRDRSRPTFLYLAFNAPHLPNEAPVEAIDRYSDIESDNRRVHAAMVDELDRAIGRVLYTLQTEDMLDNTIIFFSSDNGGLFPMESPIVSAANFLVSVFDRPMPIAGLEFVVSNVLDGGSDNSPLPKGKGTIGEGGARVPASIWWPGKLEGNKYEGFMSISDLLPTLLEAIGEKEAIPSDLDGRSQWGALSGESPGEAPDYVITGLDGTAIYRSPWKLITGDEPQLYNIYADPLETIDVASQHADIVDSLSAAAEAWPRGVRDTPSILDRLLDPDSFGGPEDRQPWADAAHARTTNSNTAGAVKKPTSGS